MAAIANPFKTLNALCDLLGLPKDAKVRAIDLRITSAVNEATIISANVEMFATDEQIQQIETIVKESGAVPEVELRPLDPAALAVIRSGLNAVSKKVRRSVLSSLGQLFERDVKGKYTEIPPHRALCSAGCCLECMLCAVKPGAPRLCDDCLRRRTECNERHRSGAGDADMPTIMETQR